MKNSHFEKKITENFENLAISSPPVTFLKYILKAPTFLNFLAKYSPCLDPGLPGPGVGGVGHTDLAAHHVLPGPGVDGAGGLHHHPGLVVPLSYTMVRIYKFQPWFSKQIKKRSVFSFSD